MSRTTLIYSVVFFVLAGAILISYPFLKSLAPNEKQINELPRISIANLERGGFIEAEGPRYRAFILKSEAGKLRIFSVPYYDNKYKLPDPTWSRLNESCLNFGPESYGDKLVPNGKFRCLDNGEPRWELNLEWNFEGNSLVNPYEDMQVPKYEIRDHSIYFG